MKIKIITVLSFWFCTVSYSQKIEVNHNKIVTLIFPDNVIKATTGSDDFLIEYDKINPSPILFIKTKLGASESNLVVKTEGDYLFNLSLIYSKSIASDKNNVVIDENLGVSLVKRNVVKQTKTEDKIAVSDPIEDNIKTVGTNYKKESSIREDDYTIGNTVINDSENKKLNCKECESLLTLGKKIKRVYDMNYNINVQLNNVVYGNDKLYFVLEFINESDVNYNFNYIKSYVDSGKKNKYASTQYLEKNPILIYNSHRTLNANTSRIIVFVYDQFSIDNNKNLTFEINESNGERNILLQIPNVLINNPSKFKFK